MLFSKLIFLVFFIHKDISVVFLFVLKLHRTGQDNTHIFPPTVGCFDWLCPVESLGMRDVWELSWAPGARVPR